MLSTHLSLVILFLPLLALRGAHCLDPDVHASQESMQETKHERQQDVKEAVKEKFAEDEIMEDSVEYFQDGDEEGELTERADSTRQGREGWKLADGKKEAKNRRVKNKSTERKTAASRSGGVEKGSKGEKGFNIMDILRRNEDPKITKKKKPAGKSDKNGKGKRKGPPRRKENKEKVKVDDDDVPKGNRRKGNVGGKYKKIGGGMMVQDDIQNTIVTSKNNPVFSFSNYMLAGCGQTYMVTKSSNFLFTTDGGKFSRNCRTNFQSPRHTTIKFYCPVFSLTQKKCKRESLLLSESRQIKWQFCKTDVVDIMTYSNYLMVHHRRRRLSRKKCPGAFLCEVSLGHHFEPITEKPPPPKPTTHPPGPYPPPSTTATTVPTTTTTTTHPPPPPTTTTTTTTYPPPPPTTTTTTTTSTTTEATSTVPSTTTTTSPPSTTTTTTTTSTTTTSPPPPTTTTTTTTTTSPSPPPTTTTTTTTTTPSTTSPSPPPTTTTRPTTITHRPHPPGPIYTPQPPGPIYTPQPPAPPVQPKPPAPIGQRPICYGCSPFNIAVTRIVGGVEAGRGEFPFQVRLNIGGTMCSGSLITTDTVLTAAHCYGNGFRRTDVIVGDHDMYENEPYSQTIKAINVVTHERFDSSSMDNDIALLFLERPVQFSQYIAPICLSTRDDTFVDEVAISSGWGHTHYAGQVSNKLQKVALGTITNEECQKLYASKYDITENMLCTYTEAKDACQGDSGGPLVRKTKDGKWVQVGLTSFGYRCAYKDSPGVFSNVANYVDWIQRNLRGLHC
ncbi:serine proteinase stubble-like isoform X2 [Eriocheir sinensis]|nr:serine proteinase stubble-like isoform X2 [Eriocheir sinensis]